METHSVLLDAIAKKLCISAFYRGFRRELCPHILGIKGGVDHCLFFQFAGGSTKGLPPGGEWRCIPLSGLSGVSAYEGQWHTDSDFSKSDKCIDRTVACVVL